MPTYADLLQRRLAHEPGRPLVTYYDEGGAEGGQRTELSVTSFANWVAKTAGVLTDELDLAAGDHVRVDLGRHWLGPVFTGAVLTAGLVLDTSTDGRPDLLVRQVDRVGTAAQVLVCSRHPFALPVPGALPDGAVDFGRLWPNQPDSYLGVPAADSDVALAGAVDLTQAELVTAARADATDDRLLVERDAGTGPGVRVFLSALAGTGSTVWVDPADLDPGRRRHLEEVERVTRVVRD